MLFLPASLLALAAVQVSAIPIDKYTCDPSRLSLILNPNWATSPLIHTYCSSLFAPGQSSKADPPALEISPNATPTDIRKACECIVAMPPSATATLSPSTSSQQLQQKKQQAQQQQSQSLQQQQHSQQKVPLRTTEEMELKVRGGVMGQGREPYGRGAVPAPIGSELKGFGARDNLYVRGSVVDGTRDRGS